MTLATATISGQWLRPDLGRSADTVHINAATQGGRLKYGATVIDGKIPVKIGSDGSASVTIPQLPQAGLDPADAQWELVVKNSTGTYSVFFTLTADTTWDAIVETFADAVTASLLAEAQSVLDQILAVGSTLAWAASTAYTAGDVRIAPDGTAISRNTSGTSTTTFAADAANWTPVATKAGTLEQVALDATYVRVGFTNHSIMDYAAGATINDGTTSASAALTAALAAIPSGGKQRLWLPPGTYLDDAARTISKGVEMISDGATIKKGTTTVAGTFWTLNADGANLDGITFDDTAGKVTGTLIGVSSGVTAAQAKECTITAPAAIAFQATASPDLRIRNNYIKSCKSGVIINGGAARAEVRKNRITNWINYGVYAQGDTSGATTNFELIDNEITDLVFGGNPRYAVHTALNTSPNPHSNMLVEGNTVVGPGTSYTAATNQGIADGFGLYHTDILKVLGNTVTDGGDMGITVDLACTDVTIEANVCKRNDTGGIALGVGVTDVAITGNVCKNNGQNRNGDRITSRVGVWIDGALGVTVSGNTFADDQGTPTQQYGAYVVGSTNVTFRGNQHRGLSLGRVNNGGTNTNIEYDAVLTAVKSADTVRNNTATRTSDPHLTVTLEPSAFYKLEAFLIYNATATADVSISWTGPTGATANWELGGLVSTTSGTSGSINLADIAIGSANTVAGAAAKAVSLPAGWVQTSTTGGTFALQWAQAAAEVSDATLYANSYLRLTRIG